MFLRSPKLVQARSEPGTNLIVCLIDCLFAWSRCPDVEVGSCLQEACEAMEVTSWLNVPDIRLQRFGVNKLTEFNVMKVELAAYADHVSVEFFFYQSTISADTQLTAQHHIKGMRWRASRFIAQLDGGNLLFAAGPFEISF